MRKNKSVIYDGIIVFLIVEIIMIFLYILGKYAPFEENFLACMDVNTARIMRNAIKWELNNISNIAVGLK